MVHFLRKKIPEKRTFSCHTRSSSRAIIRWFERDIEIGIIKKKLMDSNFVTNKEHIRPLCHRDSWAVNNAFVSFIFSCVLHTAYWLIYLVISHIFNLQRGSHLLNLNHLIWGLYTSEAWKELINLLIAEFDE